MPRRKEKTVIRNGIEYYTIIKAFAMNVVSISLFMAGQLRSATRK